MQHTQNIAYQGFRQQWNSTCLLLLYILPDNIQHFVGTFVCCCTLYSWAQGNISNNVKMCFLCCNFQFWVQCHIKMFKYFFLKHIPLKLSTLKLICHVYAQFCKILLDLPSTAIWQSLVPPANLEISSPTFFSMSSMKILYKTGPNFGCWKVLLLILPFWKASIKHPILVFN